jgi:hypothetical protein
MPLPSSLTSLDYIMPLEKAAPGSPGFKRNIKREIEAGKPQKQAVAIAYSKSRRDTAWPTSTQDERLELPVMKPTDDDGDLIIKHLSDTEEEKLNAACDRADSIGHRLDQLERRDALNGIPK